MTLKKYYINSALYPGLLALLMTVIFFIIDNKNYKSELVTYESLAFVTMVVALAYCSSLAILCLPIFLVKLKTVQNSRLLIALCWFLLPFAWILMVFIRDIKLRLMHNEDFDSDFVHVVLLNVPFIVGLIWTYLDYRKNNYHQYDIAIGGN